MKQTDPKTHNVYTCDECGKSIHTTNVDSGVTPMFLDCESDDCIGFMRSAWYPDQLPDDFQTTHEWYKPSDNEYALLGRGTRDHVDRGGLFIRKVTDHETD